MDNIINMTEIKHFKTSICSLIGYRPTNEDYEACVENLLPSGLARDPSLAAINLYIICDGHGGPDISKYAGQMLKKFYMKKNLVYPLDKSHLVAVYKKLQSKIIEHKKEVAKESGSTAIVAIVFEGKYRKRYLQVINLGDCRAVLSKQSMPMCLTKDHKPFWPDEKRRINNLGKKNGDRVKYLDGDWRIIDLSVSRAFGDLDNIYVSQEPDVYLYEISDTDEFVVIGCDGLWDCLQNSDVINFVHDHLTNNYVNYYVINGKYPTKLSVNTSDISIKLAEYAIASGSSDNVSVIIFSLK